jgi:hypothetical protein
VEGAVFVADNPTLDQLVPAWAKELAGARSSVRLEWEDWLWCNLAKDIGNGFLDYSGAPGTGRRSGVQVITPGDQTQFIEGRRLSGAVREMGHCIILTKGAILAFVDQHRLRPPSWCSDVPEAVSSPSPEGLQAPPTPTYTRGSQPSQLSEDLKQASEAKIIEGIRAEYRDAKAAGRKPPNVRELSAAVQPQLKRQGFKASKLSIEELATAPEFEGCRRPPGRTVASERRKK